MKIDRHSLDEAAHAGVITQEQAGRLWDFLARTGAGAAHEAPRFQFTHILYYLGGMVAIGAMSLFMTLGWQSFGGFGLFLIAVAYGTLAVGLTHYFLEKKNLAIPAGIMMTLVVTLVPLAVYGLLDGMGWWVNGSAYRDFHHYIKWNWLVMEFATLAAGAALLWRHRFPFMVMPIAVTLWYMSMDLTPFLFGDDPDWKTREWMSLWFGLLTVVFAFWVDLRTHRSGKDYAFWLYLFGVIAFWGGMSMMNSDSELNKLIYLLINLAMILTGAALRRRVFAVFGGLGVAGYLGHLAWEVFKDSLLFPFVLTVIGLSIIGLGILWQRHEQALNAYLLARIPSPLRELLQQRQD